MAKIQLNDEYNGNTYHVVLSLQFEDTIQDNMSNRLVTKRPKQDGPKR